MNRLRATLLVIVSLAAAVLAILFVPIAGVIAWLLAPVRTSGKIASLKTSSSIFWKSSQKSRWFSPSAQSSESTLAWDLWLFDHVFHAEAFPFQGNGFCVM
jgi:hypothetical protein